MTKTKVKDGKKVEEKPLFKEKTMSQILIEQNQKMDELAYIPNDPDLPPNWYKNPDLLYQEELKRWDSLNKENLSINELKERLIKAEMLIEYELYTEHRLLQLYVEGRITIKKAIERDIKTRESKVAGLSKKTIAFRDQAKRIIEEITENKRSIHQNDFEKFRIKFKRPASTARKYWQNLTGFQSTKKVHII
jgi:hypothetical protein